jgi:hypothetical protein
MARESGLFVFGEIKAATSRAALFAFGYSQISHGRHANATHRLRLHCFERANREVPKIRRVKASGLRNFDLKRPYLPLREIRAFSSSAL